MSRATMSLAPPAANGTIRRMARDGQVCAVAGMEISAAKASPAIRHAAPEFTIRRSGMVTLRRCLRDATTLEHTAKCEPRHTSLGSEVVLLELCMTPAISWRAQWHVGRKGAAMSPTRQDSDRACNRPAAIDGHSAEGAGRPRIFILSNVRLYREGLAVTLGRTNAVDILGAGAPPDAFARVAELLPDVVVLDSSLDDSLSLPRQMREIVPGIKIVAFAVSGVEQDVIACAEAGISAFVPREGSTEDLINAVRQAIRGELVCSPRVTALLFDRVAALSAGRIKSVDGHALTA